MGYKKKGTSSFLGSGKRKKGAFEKAVDNYLKKPKKQPRVSGGQDSRKVHDTKGKNTHGRRY